jgi:hypothetical protein
MAINAFFPTPVLPFNLVYPITQRKVYTHQVLLRWYRQKISLSVLLIIFITTPYTLFILYAEKQLNQFKKELAPIEQRWQHHLQHTQSQLHNRQQTALLYRDWANRQRPLAYLADLGALDDRAGLHKIHLQQSPHGLQFIQLEGKTDAPDRVFNALNTLRHLPGWEELQLISLETSAQAQGKARHLWRAESKAH